MKDNVKGCTLFYNAIRKYGADMFKPEILCYCEIDERDQLEIKYINDLNATDRNIGYNIYFGGNNVKRTITEKFRESISKSQNNPTGIMNIKEIKSRKDKTIVIGYKVSRDIRYYKDKITKEIQGYRVEIQKNKVKYAKSFGKRSMTMEEKLKLAIEYRDEILENLRKNQQSSSKEDMDDPQPSLLPSVASTVKEEGSESKCLWVFVHYVNKGLRYSPIVTALF